MKKISAVGAQKIRKRLMPPTLLEMRFCGGYQFVQFTKAKSEVKTPDQAEL